MSKSVRRWKKPRPLATSNKFWIASNLEATSTTRRTVSEMCVCVCVCVISAHTDTLPLISHATNEQTTNAFFRRISSHLRVSPVRPPHLDSGWEDSPVLGL